MMNFAGGALLEATTSYIVQKLGDFAVGRSQQFLEIVDDINSIKGEFLMMKAILKDAERRMATSEAFNEWMKQVKNAAFMIEDFMDECLYAEQAFQAGSSSSSSDKVQTFNWQVVKKIEAIKNEIGNVSRRGQAYGLHLMQSFYHGCEQDEGESSRAIRHSPVHLCPFQEVDVVGFDEDVRKLMDWLLTEDDHPLSVIGIVGMGGSGKTTLAKKVYSLVQNHFDHHYWSTTRLYYLSQKCNRMALYPNAAPNAEFLEDIYDGLSKGGQSRCVRRKLMDGDETGKSIVIQERKLQRSLRILLQKKRYMLFFDDINRFDNDLLRYLSSVLPSNGKGKIVFTSREKLNDPNVKFHVLNQLPFDFAWNLFCRKAFQNYSPPGSCPRYLNELGAAIVRSCCGLPLAIVLMGCLMSKKGNSPRQWKDVVDQDLLQNPGLESLNGILQATYSHLPSHLKYCFMFCCLFPKYHRIKRKKITRLWVAQRLVEKTRGKLLEDVADDYFIQLIERNFLQPIISEFTGEIIACKVHEIMHDFAIGKFPEEFGILTEEPCNECEQKRLLALQNSRIPCQRQHSKARSFLFFNFSTSSDHHLYELLSYKYLMVLCLDDMVIKELPGALGVLLNLRYLSLKRTKIKVLPDSLGKLYNLETLDVRDTEIQSLPTNLGNLRKLRHLLLKNLKVYSTNRLVIMPASIGNLNLLQTLSGVEADDNFVREVRHLVQLRKLYIRLTNLEHSNEQNCPENPHKQLFASVHEIESLCSLKVESFDQKGKFIELRLETSLPFPAYLEKLALGGVLLEFPPWFGHLRSLRVLVLINSLLIADPLSDLAVLPNLISLKLIHAYTGEHMGCDPGGFPKLLHLHIASLVEFEEWTAIAEGAMPCIQFLSIIDCKKLRMLPEGFEQLKTLQSLEVIDMPKKFIKRLMQRDHSKIQYIPKRNFH